MPELELVKSLLNARPSIAHVKIYGHTDDDSSDVYNRNLSDQRAKAVMNWFIRNGFEFERFSLLARGETLPLLPNNTPENKQRNRRATFRRGNPRF